MLMFVLYTGIVVTIQCAIRVVEIQIIAPTTKLSNNYHQLISNSINYVFGQLHEIKSPFPLHSPCYYRFNTFEISIIQSAHKYQKLFIEL